jgi:uncharacterized protein YbbC (DUF1343 family)
MKYKGYLFQDNGCDYMATACGYVMIDLKSLTKIEAMNELIEIIKEEFSHDERRLSKAQLLEINSIEDINLDELYDKIDEEELNEDIKIKEQEELKEFEKLKKKFKGK